MSTTGADAAASPSRLHVNTSSVTFGKPVTKPVRKNASALAWSTTIFSFIASERTLVSRRRSAAMLLKHPSLSAQLYRKAVIARTWSRKVHPRGSRKRSWKARMFLGPSVHVPKRWDLLRGIHAWHTSDVALRAVVSPERWSMISSTSSCGKFIVAYAHVQNRKF